MEQNKMISRQGPPSPESSLGPEKKGELGSQVLKSWRADSPLPAIATQGRSSLQLPALAWNGGAPGPRSSWEAFPGSWGQVLVRIKTLSQGSTRHASPPNGLQGRIWIHLRVQGRRTVAEFLDVGEEGALQGLAAASLLGRRREAWAGLLRHHFGVLWGSFRLFRDGHMQPVHIDTILATHAGCPAAKWMQGDGSNDKGQLQEQFGCAWDVHTHLESVIHTKDSALQNGRSHGRNFQCPPLPKLSFPCSNGLPHNARHH